MKILATYNIKGGVGKTASAVNLAWMAARDGIPTLVWDLDPQAAATYYFRIKPKIKGGGRGLVSGKHALEDLIKGTDFEGLDLLPADFSYRHLDLLLDVNRLTMSYALAGHPDPILARRGSRDGRGVGRQWARGQADSPERRAL